MSQYHLARDGRQLGVFSEEEVNSGLAAGRFSPSDLHWTEGMGDWQPVSTRFSTQPIYAQTPVPASSPAVFNPYAAPLAKVTNGALEGVMLASLGKRLGAFLLDALVGFVVSGIPYVIFIVSMQPNYPSNEPPVFSSTSIGAMIAMIVGGLALLVINCVLLAKRGQSLGKKWVGIRIVTFPEGQKPGFVKAFLLRAFVNGIIASVPCLGFIYAIVDICFIFREDRRCIHDLIASTHVVEGNPPVE